MTRDKDLFRIQKDDKIYSEYMLDMDSGIIYNEIMISTKYNRDEEGSFINARQICNIGDMIKVLVCSIGEKNYSILYESETSKTSGIRFMYPVKYV